MSTSCRRVLRYVVSIVVALLISHAVALAGPGDLAYTPSIDDWGETGLLEMPNARFEPDGTFDLGANFTYPYYRYYITAQLLPWLQGTIRYLNIRDRLYGPVYFSGHKTYFDRSFGLKLRLAKEGPYTPEIAVGFRDIAGSSLIAGEYVVASRRYYNWDFTVGLGWGYLGTRGGLPNPFGLLSSGFKAQRSESLAGSFNFTYFHGPRISPFGGIEYLTPIKGLRLKAEYDGNNYQQEPLGNRFNVRWPVNFGFDYQLPLGFTFAGGLERGNTLMFQINLETNLNSQGIPRLDLPPPPVGPAPGTQSQAATGSSVAVPVRPIPISVTKNEGPNPVVGGPSTRLLDANFAKLGIHVLSLKLDRRRAIVAVDANEPAPKNWALAAAAWLLAQSPPAGPIDTVTYVARRDGRDVAQTSFAISDIAQSIRLAASPIALVPPPNPGWAEAFGSHPSPRNTSRDIFAALAKAGLGGAALSLHGTQATITESHTQLPDRIRLGKTADALVAAAAPAVALDAVTFVGLDASGRAVRETFLTSPYSGPGHVAGPTPLRVAYQPSQAELEQSAREIFAALQAQGLHGERFSVKNRRATLYFSQSKYFVATKAIGRAARILAHYAPPDVLQLSLVETENGLPVTRVTMLRHDVVKAVNYEGSIDEIWQNTTITSAHYPRGGGIWARRYPNLTWSIMPKLRDQIGGPNGFFFYQLWMNGETELHLLPGLAVTASVGANMYNNFSNLTLSSNSALPHVRSDITKYLKGANVWLDQLHADYLFKFAPNWYGRVSAGIFELMFGGVGGEVLYRPLGKTWAFGLDFNHVWQRDYSGAFGFLNYSVNTGHLTWYQRLPGHMLMELSFGRYLAGDTGATLTLIRTFKSGIQLGAFATKTNVPAAQFGEGSFDKGVFIRIPLDLLIGAPTAETASFLYRPLTRDGGQMLDTPDPLYEVTDPASYRAIADGWGDLLK